MEKETVTDLEFRSLNDEIKQVMRRSAADVVRLGYLLRRMMEGCLWERMYNCFDEYLETELHMDYTMANRFVGINKKYSVDGGSADIDTKWEGYSQAVLIEMLSMPPELEKQITPDMTVRQVREVKRQARKEASRAEHNAPLAEHRASGTEPEGPLAGHKTPWTDLESEKDVFPGQAGVEEWPDSMPEESSGSGQEKTLDPVKMSADFSGKDEVPDVEYRELGAAEDIAVPQPEKSAYGLERTVYPPGSLLSEAGCGHKYNCFSCAQDCGIRQKYRYCRYAPLGNPFGCETMETLAEIRTEIGEKCQFINNDFADHTAGSGEADPCCEDCRENCTYRCQRSCQGLVDIATSQPGSGEAEEKDTEPQISEADQEETSADEELPDITDDTAKVRSILKHERKTLDEYLAVDGLPEKMVFRQKSIVTALEAMILNLEKEEQEPGQESPKEQPPLPVLKNNTQRKDWLGDYKAWGLWYRDENIGVDYYKYDFANGARLIAEVYQEEATQYRDAYDSCYLHLVGGPKPPTGHYGVGKWQWHKKYSRYPNSETELVEFLKEVQKKK